MYLRSRHQRTLERIFATPTPTDIRWAELESLMIALDIEEGADIIMIKPALPNHDALSHLRRNHTVPAAAYQVSGEYAMIHAAAQRGWLDLERVALESLTCIKRAGADMIISYFAKEALKWLGA